MVRITSSASDDSLPRRAHPAPADAETCKPRARGNRCWEGGERMQEGEGRMKKGGQKRYSGDGDPQNPQVPRVMSSMLLPAGSRK